MSPIDCRYIIFSNKTDTQPMNKRRNSKRVETFMIQSEKGFTPVYMFNWSKSPVIPSIMMNISQGGCMLLVPKTDPLDSPSLYLKILSSDQIVREDVNIIASLRWSNPGYSIEHKTIGLEFIEPHDQRVNIERLIQCFNRQKKEDLFVRCELSAPPG